MYQWQNILFNEEFLLPNILHALIILFIGMICEVVKNRFIKRITKNQKINKITNYTELFFCVVKKPLSFCIGFITIFTAINVFNHLNPQHIIFRYRDEILKLGIIFIIVWSVHSYILHLTKNIINKKLVLDNVDATSVLAISKLSVAILYVIALLMILPILGIPVTGILTLGGVSGLAVGFASKEIIANFLSGAFLYIERPFSVGDYIESADVKVQGTVLDIGWRNTKIRYPDGRIIFVSNASLASMNIVNVASRTRREIEQIIRIRYEDQEQLPAVIAALENMLHNNPDIDQANTIYVGLNNYGTSSLDIKLWCFSKKIQTVDFLRFKHSLLIDILTLLKEQNVKIAYAAPAP